MKYCKLCGRPMEDHDKFCAACGARQSGEYTANPTLPACGEPEPLDKLYLELAYSGVFFWLPLVAGKTEEKKAHANRGLWLLILATACCVTIQLIRWGTGFLGTMGTILFKIAFFPFMLAMFFLTANSIRGALAVHQDTAFPKMLWFDDCRFIGR